jgi:hypothetical protein
MVSLSSASNRHGCRAVVPGAGDGEPIVIHADHINMAKFESKSDSGYYTVSGHLQVIAARAGDSIGGR